jgi:pimeloyl-ACP methyl ester carboxylesterase
MTAIGIRPFKLDVPESELDDLRERLRRTRWPAAAPGDPWIYGTDLAYLKELVAYWLDGYNWRAWEARLNELPQFIAPVDGRDVHFVHVRGKGPNPLPLLISHGWPGSFVEMLDVIGPLADPAAHGGDPADAFDVVVPSLPGYGFSAPATEPGMTPRAIANVFARLMTDVLGYPRFAAQGGDWGAIITTNLARDHADKLAGIHLNMMVARAPQGPDAPPPSEEEQALLRNAEAWRNEETGYQQIQGTKPQTLAYALTDSPTGLAAWIVEKFRAWSDCHGDVETSFTKDQLLTNIMIYWLSGCIGPSMRLYYESRHNPADSFPRERMATPTAFAGFPGEPFRPPRAWAERTYNIQRWSEMPRGGHFAAMEVPELYVDDVRAFFRSLR